MAGRSKPAGSDIVVIKKGILEKMAQCVDGKEVSHLADAYARLCEAEATELRNFSEMLDLQNRQKSGYNPYVPYVQTTTGYTYSTGSGLITNAKGT